MKERMIYQERPLAPYEFILACTPLRDGCLRSLPTIRIATKMNHPNRSNVQ